MPKRKITLEDKEIIGERLDKGARYDEVADDFGISVRHVRNIEKQLEEIRELKMAKFRQQTQCEPWGNEEIIDPQLVRFWMQRVYARGVRIPKNEFQKKDTILPIGYMKERLAMWSNMPDAQLLDMWESAMVDAYFAFHPNAEEYLEDLI